MAIDLPEGFEDAEAITSRFKDPADLARAYRELEKKLGSALPRPTSSDEMDGLMKRLGAPDGPEGYVAPPGVDPNSIAGLQEWAAQARLTPEQFNRVAEQMHAAKADEFEAQRSAHDNELSAIQKEFGEGFGAAQARVVRALEEMEPGERASYNPEDPAHFKLLERLGRRGEGPATLAPSKGSAGPSDAFDAQVVAEEARRILESPAYRDKFHDEHQIARDEYGKRAYKLFQAGFDGAYDERLQRKQSGWGV